MDSSVIAPHLASDLPVRVLHVVGIMNHGGIETFLMNIYRKLDRTRVQFDFLAAHPEKGAYDDEIRSLGGIVHRLLSAKKVGPIAFMKQVDSFYRHHPEYKIVHCHMNAWSAVFLGVARHRKVTVRVAHSHIAPPGGSLRRLHSRRNYLIKQVMRLFVSAGATHFFACSTAAGEWLYGRSIALHRLVLVPNAIDSERFTYDTSSALLVRRAMGVSDDALVIGHVGRMNRQKNHVFLVEIFRELRAIRNNAVLCLVGDGDLRGEIERVVSQNGLTESVKFLGTRTDVPDLLRGFDVFVMPSLFEGLPVSVIEAQGASLPCVLSDTITREVDMGMDLLHFQSLAESPRAWAETVERASRKNRCCSAEPLRLRGYDSRDLALKLEEFYWRQAIKPDRRDGIPGIAPCCGKRMEVV